MKRVVLILVWCLSSWGAACDLEYKPAELKQLRRSQGWTLPGVHDFDNNAELHMEGLPPLQNIGGISHQLLKHEFPYVIEFPDEEFVLNGSKFRLRKRQYLAQIIRTVKGNSIVAYEYGLIPVTAHKDRNHKWIIDSEMGCIFNATFIDEKGNGIFNVLINSQLTDYLLPDWAKPSSGAEANLPPL
jgi:hypothetical protein